MSNTQKPAVVVDERVLIATGAPVTYKNKDGVEKMMFSMAVNLQALESVKGSGKELIAQVCADGKLRINAIPQKARSVSQFSRTL